MIKALNEHYGVQQEAIARLTKISAELSSFGESLDELQLPQLIEQVADWSDWAGEQIMAVHDRPVPAAVSAAAQR